MRGTATTGTQSATCQSPVKAVAATIVIAGTGSFVEVRETNEEGANDLEFIRTGDTCGMATFICTNKGTIITADVTSSTANATFAQEG